MAASERPRCSSSGPAPTAWRPRPRPRRLGVATRGAGRADGVLASGTCRPRCSCARAATGISTPPASTRSTPTSRRGARPARARPDPDRRLHRLRRLVHRPEGDRAAPRARPRPGARATAAGSRRGWRTARPSSRTASSPRRASRRSPSSRPRCADRLAPGQWSHTSRTVEFDGLRGRRCLILGGRQSAFEWAALLAEAGAARVDVVHRHDTPEFTASDWSFVDDLLARTRQTRGWFRRLPESERAAIAQRFWQVGRLQLEPWLADRIARDTVHLWPRAEPARDRRRAGGGGHRHARRRHPPRDRPRAARHRLPRSTCGACPTSPDDELELADGFPVLDEDFQTSLAGLYVPGFPSTRDFGPFFGFVAGATTTAAIIGAALARGDLAWTPPATPGRTPTSCCRAPIERRRSRPRTSSWLATSAYMLGRDEDYVRAPGARPPGCTWTPATRCARRAARSGSGINAHAARGDGPRERAGWVARSGSSSARGATASSAATC